MPPGKRLKSKRSLPAGRVIGIVLLDVSVEPAQDILAIGNKDKSVAAELAKGVQQKFQRRAVGGEEFCDIFSQSHGIAQLEINRDELGEDELIVNVHLVGGLEEQL